MRHFTTNLEWFKNWGKAETNSKKNTYTDFIANGVFMNLFNKAMFDIKLSTILLKQICEIILEHTVSTLQVRNWSVVAFPNELVIY